MPQSPVQIDEQFDIKQYAKESDGKLTNLESRIRVLEEKLGTNESLANTFSETVKTQKIIDDTLSAIVKKLIEKDSGVKDVLKKIIDQIDRNYFNSKIKQFGVLIWSVLLIIIGSFLQALFSYVMPHR